MIYKEVTKGNKKLIIQTDDDSESSREWDNLGTMVCFHSRYNLGDEQLKGDHFDWLAGIVDNLYSRDTEQWDEFIDDIQQGQEEAVERAWDLIYAKAIILPLYLYDHGGITMSTGSFSCPWDSGQVGWIYVLKEVVRKEYDKKRISRQLRDRVIRVLEGEVETYDQYLRGDVYGFQIFETKQCETCGNEEEEIIDSCWGFYGEDWGNMKGHVTEEYHKLFEEL